MKNKLITIITPCFNEEDNVEELSMRIKIAMQNQPYLYEHVFIDNSSTDSTVEKIKTLIDSDKCIRLIVNARNFGQLRSPYYALTKARGDAVIIIASDLQDPPELIPNLLKKWEMGFKSVLIVKRISQENKAMFFVRKIFYRLMSILSEVQIIENAHGSGLYDRLVVNQLTKINDSYPYLRGLLSEIGYPIGTVDFNQPKRHRGVTKNNFYSLFDVAILGITNHSKLPLRTITLSGLLLSIFFGICALIYIFLKLIYWEEFTGGAALIIIGLFFLGSIQLFFLGILGEYIGSIHTQVRKFPLVIEAERVNYD